MDTSKDDFFKDVRILTKIIREKKEKGGKTDNGTSSRYQDNRQFRGSS